MDINLEEFRRVFEPIYVDLKSELNQYQNNISIPIETNGSFNSTYQHLVMTVDRDDLENNNVCAVVKEFLERITDNKINPIQVAENVLLMAITNIMLYRQVFSKKKLISGTWETEVWNGTTVFFNATTKSIYFKRTLKWLSTKFSFIIILDNLKSDKIRVLYEKDGIAEEVCSDLANLSLETLNQHLDTFLKNVRGD